MKLMQLGLFEVSSPPLPFGKMLLESLTPKTTPLDAFWEHLQGKIASYSQQGKNGQTLVVCLDHKEQSRGESSTPNISEWPNDADVCLLSQVLEKDSIQQKYYLSSTACAGILRRAEVRGKKLPEATRSTTQGFAESSFAQFRPTHGDCGTLKRSGGVLAGGSETFIITPQYASGGEVCDTVTRKLAKGSGGLSGNETGNLAIHPKVVHGTQDPITQDNQAFPLGCNHGQENVVAVLGGLHPNAAMGKNLCSTITQAMGMGGGHIPIVNTYGIPGNWIGRKPENGGNATEPMDNIAPCQTKTDRHAVAYGIQGNMIGRSDTAGPQGSGVSSNISFTLTKGDKHAVATSLVRRLTPTECERLQGFPDSYTKIPYRNKKADDCPDGPRYAALGNSMAVPVMRWIGERIQKHIDWAI